MTIENTGVALAQQAAEALRALGEYGPHLSPDGSDRFLWSADVLDELARVAALLGDAVGQAAGDPSVGVEQHAEQLATAIIAHRNSLLRHGRGADPFGGHGDGADPFGSGDPFAHRGDRVSGPVTAVASSR